MIVTPLEIKKHASFLTHFDEANYCNKIGPIVEPEIKRCFGKAFFEYLRDGRIFYDEADVWMESKTYALDDLVKYHKGRIYMSLKDNNTDYPSEELSWSQPRPYSDVVISDLFEYYILPYLSHAISIIAITPATVKAQNAGLSLVAGKNTVVITPIMLSAWITQAKVDYDRCLRNLKEKIKELHDDEEIDFEELIPEFDSICNSVDNCDIHAKSDRTAW